MELDLVGTVRGELWSDIMNRVTLQLRTIGITERSYTHIMYVLPESVNFQGFAGFAYIGW